MEYKIDIIEVLNSSGTIVADLSGRALSRKISKKRNQADVIELSFDLDNLREYCKSINCTIWDIFIVNSSEVKIKRDDMVISAGQVCYARPSISGDSRTFSVKAVGWFDLFAKRNTIAEREFTSVDAGEIAWTLIDESQQEEDGDFGITRGTIQPSKNRDRTYSYKNVKDAIVQLSDVTNGFDFEIDHNKKFNVYYPKIGLKRDDVIFTYPGNIRDISFERDGMKMANKNIAVGAGTGVNALRTEAVNVNSRGRYKLRESVLQYPDVQDIVILGEHADSEIIVSSNYLDMPELVLDGNIDPQFGRYGIGDEIILQVEDDEIFAPVNGWWRIEAIDLSIDENNHEDVRLRVMR